VRLGLVEMRSDTPILFRGRCHYLTSQGACALTLATAYCKRTFPANRKPAPDEGAKPSSVRSAALSCADARRLVSSGPGSHSDRNITLADDHDQRHDGGKHDLGPSLFRPAGGAAQKELAPLRVAGGVGANGDFGFCRNRTARRHIRQPHRNRLMRADRSRAVSLVYRRRGELVHRLIIAPNHAPGVGPQQKTFPLIHYRVAEDATILADIVAASSVRSNAVAPQDHQRGLVMSDLRRKDRHVRNVPKHGNVSSGRRQFGAGTCAIRRADCPDSLLVLKIPAMLLEK
jgi:hypothetical protein